MTGSSHRVRGWIMTCRRARARRARRSRRRRAPSRPSRTGGVAKLTPQSRDAAGQGQRQRRPARRTSSSTARRRATAPSRRPASPATARAARSTSSRRLAGLAPATTYHYRLVASNRNGTTSAAPTGRSRRRRQPLGLVLAATPNPVPFGRPTVLAGTLSGTGNASRQILLQSNPFPYTQGFAPTANVQLTNAAGQFAFPLLSVRAQHAVPRRDPRPAGGREPDRQRRRRRARRRRTRARRACARGRRVRFFGTVRPARPGAQFAIQLLRQGAWRTVAGGITRGAARRRVALRQARPDPPRRPVPRVRRDRRRQLRLQRRADGEDQPDLLSLRDEQVDGLADGVEAAPRDRVEVVLQRVALRVVEVDDVDRRDRRAG